MRRTTEEPVRPHKRQQILEILKYQSPITFSELLTRAKLSNLEADRLLPEMFTEGSIRKVGRCPLRIGKGAS